MLTRILLENGSYTITGEQGDRVVIIRGYIDRRNTGYGVKQAIENHPRHGIGAPKYLDPVELGDTFETYEAALSELAGTYEAALLTMDGYLEESFFHELAHGDYPIFPEPMGTPQVRLPQYIVRELQAAGYQQDAQGNFYRVEGNDRK